MIFDGCSLDVTHTNFISSQLHGPLPPTNLQTCRGQQRPAKCSGDVLIISSKRLVLFAFGNVGTGGGGLVCVCARACMRPSLFPRPMTSRLYHLNMGPNFIQNQFLFCT